MSFLTRDEAHDILAEASKLYDGKWVAHSINVAKVAERLADSLNLDKDKAYVYGLLHDIGRRAKGNVRHIIDGYNYMKSLGYEEIGRYCLTHSYFVNDVYSILGKWDLTDTETDFVKDYIDNIKYNLYDKIVQIGDYMALPEGLTLIERRIVDIYLRYGINDKAVSNWKAIFQVQAYIEQILGHSIYKLFPEINENINTHLIKDILTF